MIHYINLQLPTSEYSGPQSFFSISTTGLRKPWLPHWTLKTGLLNKTCRGSYSSAQTVLITTVNTPKAANKEEESQPPGHEARPAPSQARAGAFAPDARAPRSGAPRARGAAGARAPRVRGGGVAGPAPAFVVPRGARGEGRPEAREPSSRPRPPSRGLLGPYGRADPPSCSACPARPAPNPAGTPSPGSPKTCSPGPRPSADKRPGPWPPPRLLRPRRRWSSPALRRPPPRPSSPSVVPTARPSPALAACPVRTRAPARAAATAASRPRPANPLPARKPGPASSRDRRPNRREHARTHAQHSRRAGLGRAPPPASSACTADRLPATPHSLGFRACGCFPGTCVESLCSLQLHGGCVTVCHRRGERSWCEMFREESAFRVSRASSGTHTPGGNLRLSSLAFRPSARSDPVVLCKHPSGTHTFGFTHLPSPSRLQPHQLITALGRSQQLFPRPGPLIVSFVK